MAWAPNKFIQIFGIDPSVTNLYVVIIAWDSPGDNGKIAEGTASGGDPIAPWTLTPIADANWALCKVPVAAEGGSFIQMGSFPELPLGDYSTAAWAQAGLIADKTLDTFQQGLGGIMPWDGEKPVGLARSMAKIATAAEIAAALLAVPIVGPVFSIVAGEISFVRGDSATFSLTGLGNITGNLEVWFTAKRHASDADTAAVIQVSRTVGLVYLNGAAGTAGDASLTVDDATAGDITIALEPAASALIDPMGLRYDVQVKTGAGDINTLAVGVVEVLADYTRAIT